MAGDFLRRHRELPTALHLSLLFSQCQSDGAVCLQLAFHLRDDLFELLSVGESSGADCEVLGCEAKSGERE